MVVGDFLEVSFINPYNDSRGVFQNAQTKFDFYNAFSVKTPVTVTA